MKKKLLLITLSLFIATIMTACGYKETNEYPIESARVWEERDESGVFTTKVNTTTWIEIIYKTKDGYEKYNEYPTSIEISDENKVLEEEGCTYQQTFMTIEFYESLFK